MGLLFLIIAGTAVVLYIFTDNNPDTASVSPDFTLNATPFIKEFIANKKIASDKYAEKTIIINGKVSEIEPADTLHNVKMVDTATGSYILFAFQQKDAGRAKALQAGDSISIKGSCNGGAYSEILETHYITFKRSILINHFK